MLRRTLALCLAALALPATAAAGGWATSGISPMPPDDPGSGDTWKTTITVLQHGRTPLDGVQPTLMLRNGDQVKTFAATPTGEPGKYAVEVTFPSSGTWAIAVDDGFSQYGQAQTTTFGSVDVGGPASTGGEFPVGWTLGGVGAVLLAVAAFLLWWRRPLAPTPARVA